MIQYVFFIFMSFELVAFFAEFGRFFAFFPFFTGFPFDFWSVFTTFGVPIATKKGLQNVFYC